MPAYRDGQIVYGVEQALANARSTVSSLGARLEDLEFEPLPLPAGATVELKVGHLHLMLLNLKTDLIEGDPLPVRLVWPTMSTRTSWWAALPTAPLKRVMKPFSAAIAVPVSTSES